MPRGIRGLASASRTRAHLPRPLLPVALGDYVAGRPRTADGGTPGYERLSRNDFLRAPAAQFHAAFGKLADDCAGSRRKRG